MKFISTLASLILLPALAFADSVSFDPVYDMGSESMNVVACSSAIEARGFQTFGSLPDFPFIGGAAAVEGFGSANCGTCWNLTFVTLGVSNTISVLAIDTASLGFNIALTAMNQLTDGQAIALGRINAASVQVDPSVCGLA